MIFSLVPSLPDRTDRLRPHRLHLVPEYMFHPRLDLRIAMILFPLPRMQGPVPPGPVMNPAIPQSPRWRGPAPGNRAPMHPLPPPCGSPLWDS